LSWSNPLRELNKSGQQVRLFDHLVTAGEQRRGHNERLGMIPRPASFSEFFEDSAVRLSRIAKEGMNQLLSNRGAL
jgi:hypothetical protein